MNGRPSFLEFVSRLPPRVWLQAALGLIGLLVLAVLGFALIAGFVAVALVVLLLYRLRTWVARLFAGRTPEAGPPARTDEHKVIDVPYEVIERPKDKGP